MSNFPTLKISATAALLALTIGFTLPAIAQEADAPPAAEETTPPDADSAAPSDEATPPEATPPDDNSDAPPSDEAPSDDNGGSDASSGGAEPMQAPTTPDAGDQTAETPSTDLKAADLTLNAPVIGSDGKEIGTISRISSTAEGNVAKIYVKVGDSDVIIPGSAIAEGGSNVKLSLSSDEVSKLPTTSDDDNSNG